MTMTTTTPMPSTTELNHTNIQGNILAGFNKDYQTFLFVRFTDIPAARAWLAEVTSEVATSAEVMAFNGLFKAVNARRQQRRRRDDRSAIRATWMNIALTYQGLQALG